MSSNILTKLDIDKIFHSVYKNKTVLITGHTGFQGTWLTFWLKILGAKIIGYSIDVPTTPSMFELLKLESEIVHIIGDINDLKKFQSVINEYKPDIVFHLAAQPIVRTSYEKPIETFHTNVLGTANVLESIRNETNTKVCVVMTSDKCYENPIDGHPCKEDEKMGGNDPYSASKGAAEIIAASYRKSFFNKKDHCKIATTRVGNVIGGGDWAKDRLVPDCVRALIDGQKIIIRNPQSIRPWQHVLEPISAILWLAAKIYLESKYSEGWNFGPNSSSNDVTVKDVVEQILEEWGSGTFEHSDEKSSEYETKELRLDSSKASNILQWKTIFSIKEAITETINWYKIFATNEEKLKEITEEQIQNYIERAKKKNISWSKF